MPINTLQYATIFQQALDKQMVALATSGWMEANAGQVKYNGGAEVKIPKLSLQGLADYDRDDGFVQGSVTLEYQTFTMTQDRGRTFQLDAMDVDETGFVANATTVMSEFQRVHVVPEVDAYRYSKIYALANTAGKVTTGYTPGASDILAKLKEDIAAVEDVAGDLADLVITMSIPAANILDQCDQLRRVLDVTDFTKGGVTTKVKSLDGVPIIKVPSNRMKTAYVIKDGTSTGQEAGGFAPAEGAKQVNWIICRRSVPIAISKTEKVRIFEPNVNQKADAWKLDYRKYHDLWIPENRLAAVRVNIGA
jgi:hypothetical protein